MKPLGNDVWWSDGGHPDYGRKCSFCAADLTNIGHYVRSLGRGPMPRACADCGNLALILWADLG